VPEIGRSFLKEAKNKENRKMRYIGFAFIIVLSGCDQPGRYQIEAAKGSTQAEDRVWILDTKTGQVSLCFEHGGAIKCLKESAIPPKT